MPPLINHTGKRFDRLTVLEFVGRKKTHSMWKVRCDCGNIKIVAANSLQSGLCRSCGCIQIKHGRCKTSEYDAWHSMIGRCCLPKNKNYIRYGGRGITVCDRWRKSFSAFYEDMGEKPSPELTIDRIDGTKGYYKENCRWATWTQQTRNKRTNHLIEFDGKNITITDAAAMIGASVGCLYYRLRAGWPRHLLFIKAVPGQKIKNTIGRK